MSIETPPAKADMLELTVDIVSAYVSKNATMPPDLPGIIVAVYGCIFGISAPTTAAVEQRPEPHVMIKRTVTPDYIISLEDGQRYKVLKRHLTLRGLTPAEYRRKWGLPDDYPMVAAKYAARRSELAKAMGLGRRGLAARSAASARARSHRHKDA